MAALLAEDAPYPSRRAAWSVVAILIATAVLSYTDRQVLSLLVDPMRAELRISDTQVSLLIGTAFALVYGVAGIPLGVLADRISRRNLIFCGVLVWSAATIACGLSRSFHAIFIARLFVGLGEAVLSPSAISMISDYFPPARRGTAVGLFLSGIAVGVGASIFIGGGVLHAVDAGFLAGTMLAHWPAWRLVLLLIGGPGVVWAFAILLIAEPVRRAERAATPGLGNAAKGWMQAGPLYLVVAMASLVDNAMGAWGPSLLIRGFAKDPGQIGIELGLMLSAGFGGGVFVGGVLADRAGAARGLAGKLLVCLGCAGLILPASLALCASHFVVVLGAIPIYFFLSGIVTAVGFSAILDAVPNRSRGLAMSISFFLNVALGAGIGPTAVAIIGRILHAGALAPALTLTVASGYAIVGVAVLQQLRKKEAVPF